MTDPTYPTDATEPMPQPPMQPQRPLQPPYPPYAYPYSYAPTPPAAGKRRPALIGVGVGLVAAGVAVAVAVANTGSDAIAGIGSGSAGTIPQQQAPDGSGGGTFPFPNSGNGTNQTSASVANAAQQRGVVIINSVLGFQGAISAGTGMVLTSNGEIVTNNHVVEGATRISVTIPSTHARYTATVVGTDRTDDVAVIKLDGASGLQTAKIDSSATVTVGDKVVAVGNAGGTGTLTAASGAVTATGKSITAADDNGSNPEQLHNLIEVNAQVVAGDSGGPLYANNGDIIGMDTAASRSQSSVVGYAIPINDALSIVAQIDKGVQTSKIHIGPRGLLGVTVHDATGGGALVATVAPGSAADSAGIVPGDVISAVGGKAITNAATLHNVVGGTAPGQHVSVTYTDNAGTSHNATVTLGTGPAD